MIDITHKTNTLRTAVAAAIVSVSRDETIELIREKKVPKGDVIEAARVAGLLGIKNTSRVIPDCHPIPVESAKFQFEIAGKEIHIVAEVKTIYKTGVEVEAMHGVSVAALTMYDMLKPVDDGIEISNIRLINKRGGKSDIKISREETITAAVVVCSDTVSAGLKEDTSGKAISRLLKRNGIMVGDYSIVPDEKDEIAERALSYCNAGYDMVIFTGGTGVSPRDVTPEALTPLFDKELPGLTETARRYGQDRTPFAMFSRSVAGMRGGTLIIAVPGSERAATESLQPLIPHVLHLLKIAQGASHS